MVLELPYHSLKIFFVLLLIQVSLVNVGYQYLDFHFQGSVAIDICDHSDDSKDCDQQETGETDDLISQVGKTLTLPFGDTTLERVGNASGYVPNHMDIASPPPKNLLPA